MTGVAAEASAAALCRRQIRAAERATLATVANRGKAGVDGPWPYASLVLAACGHDASPLLLISDLADHTRNLRADPRVSLLYDGTAGLDDPLTGPRISLQGKAEIIDDDGLVRRYVRRHPSAEQYAGFGDFHLFRVRPVRAHLVAGFGRIYWIEGGDLVFDTGSAGALCAAEPDLLERINAEHADALGQIAARPRGGRRKGWRATGIDPEGLDLRCAAAMARVDFPKPAMTPETASKAVARMIAAARKES